MIKDIQNRFLSTFHSKSFILLIFILCFCRLNLVTLCEASNYLTPVSLSSVNSKIVSSNYSKKTSFPDSWKVTKNSMMNIRAGIKDETSKDSKSISFKKIFLRNLLGLWGCFQVLAVLGNAIKRVFPVAIQPFLQRDLSPDKWVLYAVSCLIMAYSEGYKAFHLKFSPMVVQRAFSLSNNQSLLNILFAGPYSMGLFAAPRRRIIVGWSITAGVFALVHLVKLLPYPYRSIVDAGVVTGLGLGSLSIIWKAVYSLFVKIPSDTEGDEIDKKLI